jgi:lambda repressor-like predicted transcriptional regulator
VLRTKIHPGVISTDKNVIRFVEATHKPADLGEKMKTGQKQFVRALIEKTFDFSSITRHLRYMMNDNSEGLMKDNVVKILAPIATALESERSNTEKFRRQLQGLVEGDLSAFGDRIAKGSEYYRKFVNAHLNIVLYHLEEVRRMKRVSSYLNQLTELDALLTRTLTEIDQAPVLAITIMNGGETFTDSTLSARRLEERNSMLAEIRASLPEVSSKKKKKGKKKTAGEPSTFDISVSLLKTGMSVSQIAEQRGLAGSTIESHLVRALLKGSIAITDFVNNETIDEVSEALEKSESGVEIKELYHRFKKRYSHALLRAVLHHKGMLKSEVE